MSPRHIDGTTLTALLFAALLFALAGFGWASQGADIFLATVMAGIAGCF